MTTFICDIDSYSVRCRSRGHFSTSFNSYFTVVIYICSCQVQQNILQNFFFRKNIYFFIFYFLFLNNLFC